MKKRTLAFLCTALCVCLLCSCGIISTDLPGLPNRNLTQPDDGENIDAHYYNRLDSVGQKAYRLLLNGAAAHEERIFLPEMTQEELSDAFQAVCYDNPQLIYLKNKFGWGSVGNKTFVEPDYSDSAEACAVKSAEIERAVSQAAAALNDDMDAFEKELALHDWLAEHCAYSAQSQSAYTAYGALVEGSAACEGYAKAMQLLLARAGIESFLITGQVEADGEALGHMWNVVELNGENYHLDVTWDAPQGGDGLIQHTYFNLSDEEISSDHFGFDAHGISCKAVKENFFRRTGAFFESYEALAAALEREMPQIVKNTDGVFEFRLSDSALYDEALKKLFDDGEIYDIINNAVETHGDADRFESIAHFGVRTQQTVLIELF